MCKRRNSARAPLPAAERGGCARPAHAVRALLQQHRGPVHDAAGGGISTVGRAHRPTAWRAHHLQVCTPVAVALRMRITRCLTRAGVLRAAQRPRSAPAPRPHTRERARCARLPLQDSEAITLALRMLCARCCNSIRVLCTTQRVVGVSTVGWAHGPTAWRAHIGPSARAAQPAGRSRVQGGVKPRASVASVARAVLTRVALLRCTGADANQLGRTPPGCTAP